MQFIKVSMSLYDVLCSVMDHGILLEHLTRTLQCLLSYTDFEILPRFISKEVFHFWFHCAISVYKLHRVWIEIPPHEIGARVRFRGPGGVVVSLGTESVAPVP